MTRLVFLTMYSEWNNDLMNNLIFGGTATGGNQDDYRYRVNWVASDSNRYFYKYADMEDTGKIENTMIPMLRIGEMYLIAAESQSTSLTAGSSYVNTLRSESWGNYCFIIDPRFALCMQYIREAIR